MVVQKNDSQNKVFTYGLTLGQKLESFSKEEYFTERGKKRSWRACILIEAKGKFSNIQMEQNNKKG